MTGLSVKQITSVLGISKSYLYKAVNKHNILLPKSKTGRFLWDENAVRQLKIALSLNEKNNETEWGKVVQKKGLRLATINNRRYLGNKYKLLDFIRGVVDEYCPAVNVVMDIFSGTGAVASAFSDKMIMTNDLLYCNYIIHYAWFMPEDYSEEKIINLISEYNQIETNENNYVRRNFADTFFAADSCSKIGVIRENIEKLYQKKQLNFKEYSILITSLLYAMDKIANTVGHYDAYRKNAINHEELELAVILPSKHLNQNNQCFNTDANQLVSKIQCDLLYLDPPYNSRQYCDAYHLLENIACWKKPEVSGVARKMERSKLKSDYCTKSAEQAFTDLIEKANAKYILLSYNNMANKGNDRSNAKISDDTIWRVLRKKGEVKVFEQSYKAFSTGKSDIYSHTERLFLCKVHQENKKKPFIVSPLNYIGGKHKLLSQIMPLLPESECFLDLFCGGGNVGINAKSSKIIFNDKNSELIALFDYLHHHSAEQILSNTQEIIEKFSLSNSTKNGYSFYGCESSKGLGNFNKMAFLRLREAYNQSKDIALLYTLVIFSFNNQIRFNRKGEFNLPVGKRDFNLKMQNKLRLFIERLKMIDISFQSQDFRRIDLDYLPKDTLIYCDPPYLITLAGYNENDGWTVKDEKDLLHFLDKCNQKGLKFALSNVLKAKKQENTPLIKWLEKNSYFCHYLDKSYTNSNYQRKDRDTISIEVLITNY
ncbi:Dam family site-specific DNA-(adenine-N6)-methyltransferase [Pasteurella multocida]|uniref:Dam family site-specific DNA-(adenine-N6)-methyltransferase n=1 Tax=Pasteurella multocida TaxID=747 RepID=UPI0029317B40|nr:Dam family site-specific DNA-(adenine-N6)-methyltransferase [Pasteurella multocida]